MIEKLGRRLVRVALKHYGTIPTLRKAAQEFGHVNPVGDGDAKTKSPGTYRPVGPTCPASCPYTESCYAKGGNVALHEKRATALVDDALRTAGVAFTSAAQTNRMARLHVSGDFGKVYDAELQRYVDGLCTLADTVNEGFGRAVGTGIAWSYTHLDDTSVDTPWIVQLRQHGIFVRLSDKAGEWGAIVGSFKPDAWKALRAKHPGETLMKCKAQTHKKETCHSCKWCWERPAWTIVFDPHGVRKRKALAASHTV
tara:strand:- start:323 stop:1084 length:762 start_codon:yes stop_codon:yes gene_type:complete